VGRGAHQQQLMEAEQTAHGQHVEDEVSLASSCVVV
jgi:hypothetical protein